MGYYYLTSDMLNLPQQRAYPMISQCIDWYAVMPKDWLEFNFLEYWHAHKSVILHILVGSYKHYSFYPTSLKGFFHLWCRDGWTGRQSTRKSLYLRNCKVYEVGTWWEHWLGGADVQHHGVTLI